MSGSRCYDWAQAIYALASSSSVSLNELTAAADLDPKGGDLSDVDLSNLDLSHQDLTDWNLENANLSGADLRGASIKNARLTHALVDARQIVQASDWQNAILSNELRQAALDLVEQSSSLIGTVKWFNVTKGYGFIQPDNGGNDIFVHVSAVERAGLSTLREGQKIHFEIVADRRSGKTSADNLRV